MTDRHTESKIELVRLAGKPLGFGSAAFKVTAA